MLIEDNPGDARLVRHLLTRARLEAYDLEWVGTLQKGLEYLDKGGVDIVLLDLLLPDSYGFDTLDKVVEAHPDVPVVVMTSVEEDDFIREVVQRGAQDYLPKWHLQARESDRSAALVQRCVRYAIDRRRLQSQLEGELRDMTKEERPRKAARAEEAYMILDAAGVVQSASAAAEALLGMRGNLVGRKFRVPRIRRGEVELSILRPKANPILARAQPGESGGTRTMVVTLRELPVLREEQADRRTPND